MKQQEHEARAKEKTDENKQSKSNYQTCSSFAFFSFGCGPLLGSDFGSARLIIIKLEPEFERAANN